MLKRKKYSQLQLIKTLIYIAIGGALGSVLRFLSSVFVNKYWASSFPLATLIINVLGCFLIGFLFGFFDKHGCQNHDLKYLLITGFCGGYTTFSAFGIENVFLFQSQNYFSAFLYIASSVLLGLLAVWAGIYASTC